MIEIKHKLTGEVLHVVNADRLAGSDLAGANLVVADLAQADLTGTDLGRANLAVAQLNDANLSNANLTEANLTGANLENAVLAGTRLSGANLTGANLRSANFHGADLRGANLQGADLTGANLSEANLQQASLVTARLKNVTLAGAKYDATTQYPDTLLDPRELGAAYLAAPAPTRELPVERYLSSDSIEAIAGPSYKHVAARSDQEILLLTIISQQVEGEEVAETIRQELLAAVTLAGALKVVVDFQHVKFISSVAFRPLLSLRRKMKETGGKMVLCGLSKIIGDVFYTTRLVSYSGEVAAPFEMQPDIPSAIARLTAAGSK